MSLQKKTNSMDCESEGTGLSPKFGCDKCGKALTTEYRRKLHIQFYCPDGPGKTGKCRNPDDPLICYICNDVFRTVKMMRRHLIRDCETVRWYSCQMCDFTASWAFLYQKHMFTAHSDLMEVMHDVTMGSGNQENQPETGNEEDQLETGYEEDQLETGYEEDQVETGYEEDQLVTGSMEDQMETGNVEEELDGGNEEDQLETGDEEGQLETGNEEHQPEPKNVLHIITQHFIDLTGTETQLVSENTGNQLSSDKVKDQTETPLGAENCIYPSENEDSETQSQTECTGSLLERENVEDQIETENMVTQLGSENNENQLNRVNSQNQLITKSNEVKQHANLLNKSNALQNDKKQNKNKNNKNGNETAKGVKTGKENKVEKRTREEKENDCRKKTKTENIMKVENEQSCQGTDKRVKEGETIEEAEAVVPETNLSLDRVMEGLPILSKEEFARMKAANPSFQF